MTSDHLSPEYRGATAAKWVYLLTALFVCIQPLQAFTNLQTAGIPAFWRWAPTAATLIGTALSMVIFACHRSRRELPLPDQPLLLLAAGVLLCPLVTVDLGLCSIYLYRLAVHDHPAVWPLFGLSMILGTPFVGWCWWFNLRQARNALSFPKTK